MKHLETFMQKSIALVFCILIYLALPAQNLGSPVMNASTDSRSVKIIMADDLKGPALHGIKKLQNTLKSFGFSVSNTLTDNGELLDYYIIAGLSGGEGAAYLNLEVLNIHIPDSPEALVIQKTGYRGKPAVIICGSDEAGLMYGLLDVGERISWSKKGEDLFRHVRNQQEKPFILDRSISAYTMQRKNFEEFLHDEKHVAKFFDMLALSRINSFVIIFGYENGGFMAPAYPYFFDVDGFSEVKMVGLSTAEQTVNMKAFKKLIDLAHERGIKVVPGFWDHIYRGEVQAGGIPGAARQGGAETPHLVSGITTNNLVAYNKAAITKFLDVFPNIDAIQFRMHWESGLTREETPAFWHDMLAIIKQKRPDIHLDLRAKGLPDEVIEDAINQELDFRIATKFWMEQLGLPFHPTHINTQNQKDRRHGYADLLRFPVRYPMHWKIWSGGTARFLLWGDPDYVRRFVEVTKIYPGSGFEVNQMLATKMLGEDHNNEPFQLLKPAYRYYDYEFERYWHYYQVWGRVSYNPKTPVDFWEHDFQSRFGTEAGQAIMEALHLGSKVLPRIVASSYPYRHFPTTRGWAEMHRQFDLPEYSKAEGSDIQQFMNMEEFAQMLIEKSETAKRTPFENSQWFNEISKDILEKIQHAEAAGDAIKGNEFLSTTTDLKILAQLAEYHSHRLLAGTRYNIWLKTQNLTELNEAIRLEEKARNAWAEMVQISENIYNDVLIFGVQDKGFPRNYAEELEKLDWSLKELREISENEKSKNHNAPFIAFWDSTGSENNPPEVSLERVNSTKPGEDLLIHAKVTDPSGVKWVRLRYRHLTQFEDYEVMEMNFNKQTGLYSARIPGDFVVPEWNLMYFVEAMDKSGNACMIPDLDMEIPYVIVKLER